MENQLPLEPIVLIDSSKQQEAYVLAAAHYTFDDLLRTARRINLGVFEGEWDLTYFNPATQTYESIDAQIEIGDYLDRNITTFYWHYKVAVPVVEFAKPTKRFPKRLPANWLNQLRAVQHLNLGKRAIALLIDAAIIMVLVGIFEMEAATLWVWWLYFGFFEASKYQATPGKMAMGLVVTDLNGQRLSLMRSMVRSVGHILSGIILWMGFSVLSNFILWVGFSLAIWTDRSQALHDLMAKTLVVDTNSQAQTAAHLPSTSIH